MKKKEKKSRPKSVQMGVSPKAHEVMVKKAVSMKPRRNLRELVNIMNNLPTEE